MSLNQKYTWKNFLQENPEMKAKKVKRTSAEGKKAFEAAFKAKIKDLIKDRLVFIEKREKYVTKQRNELNETLKATKEAPERKIMQAKVGRKDAYLSRLTKMTEKTKLLQKSI